MKTTDILKTMFISASLGFVGICAIVLLALLVSPVYSSIFSSFPLTLLVFAISVSISRSHEQEHIFTRSLVSSTIMYVALLLTSTVWMVLLIYAFPDQDLHHRIWYAFGCGILVWVVACVILLSLYYTNERIHDYFHNTTTADPAVAAPLGPSAESS